MTTLETPHLNVPLLREIQAAITAEPKQLSMNSWISKENRSPCGTAACIAGWACILATAKTDSETIKNTAVKLYMKTGRFSFERKASRLLGITHPQGGILFYVNLWPEPFRSEYFARNFPRNDEEYVTYHLAAAKITVARIEHFIATNGR